MTDKIECPFCHCLQSSVIPRRPTKDQQQTGGVWRRRECGGCGAVLHTEEVLRSVDPPKQAASETTSSPRTR